MCVIIDRQPGKIIPAAQLELACRINKHGYGLAYSKNGKLQFMRSLVDNDPKDVADRLQELKDYRVFLHLRHATVGKVNLANSHPFIILSQKKHGVDVAMMHNGTLYDYKPETDSDDSDTLLFTQRFVRPLAHRMLAYNKQKVLSDPFFKHILKKEAGYISIILLFDAAGNTLCVNEDKGKAYEWGWASNDHLTDTYHHRAGNIVRGGTYYEDFDWQTGDSISHLPWMSPVPSEFPEKIETWEDSLKAADRADSTPQRTAYECVRIGDKVREAKFKVGESLMAVDGNKTTMSSLKILKKSFLELSGLENYDRLGALTEGDLVEMATNYPGATARLVIDLMDDRRSLKHKNDMQAQTILDLAKK